MEIKSSAIVATTKWHKIGLEYEGVLYDLNVQSYNGRMLGNADTNLVTSDLKYQKIPFEVREAHFEQIREYLKLKK